MAASAGAMATAGVGAAHVGCARPLRAADITKISVPQGDRLTWSLFEDWCAAHDQPTLPASPNTLAQFLRAHPVASATQRRRIAVINAAHYRHALPPPGRAETVRAVLDVARTQRLRELAALIGGIVARLPKSGWPAALFARRDALILTLAATGLPYTQIAALRVCDVTADPGVDALHIGTVNGGDTVTSLDLINVGVSPTLVHRRWCEALGHHERYPSTRMLAEAIDAEGGTDLVGYDRHLDSAGEQPLLTSIDRWGHTPLVAAQLTVRAIADIVRMHLDGRAPAHPHPRVRAQRPIPDAAQEADPSVVLDPGYYERGTRARRTAHELLCDIDDALADVETRAEKVLEDLLEFLEAETDAELTTSRRDQ